MLKQITRLILITSIYILSHQYVEAACEHKYFGNGNGTVESPYEVRNTDDFNHINSHSSAAFIQTANIITHKGYYENIGVSYFYGIYDGNNYTIENSGQRKDDRGYTSQTPIFSILDGGTIKNLTITAMREVSDSVYSEPGPALVSIAEGKATIENCKLAVHNINQAPESLVEILWEQAQVINCGNIGYANSIVRSSSSKEALIRGCYNTGVLTSNFAGIVRDLDSGTVTGCYNTGTTGYPMPNRHRKGIITNGVVGGIVAAAGSGVIEKNYSSGPITAYCGESKFTTNYNSKYPNMAGGILGTAGVSPYSDAVLIVRNNYSSSVIDAKRYSLDSNHNTNTCGGIIGNASSSLTFIPSGNVQYPVSDINYYDLNITAHVEISNNYFVGNIKDEGNLISYNYRESYNFFGQIIGAANRRILKIHDNHYLNNQGLLGMAFVDQHKAPTGSQYSAAYFNIAASNEGITPQQDSFMRTSNFTALMNANQTPMAWKDGDGSWPYPKFLGANTIGIQASTPNKIGDNTSIMLNVNYVNEDCSKMIVREINTGNVLYNGAITPYITVPTATLEGDLRLEAQLLLNSNAVIASSNEIFVNKKDILNKILGEGSNKNGLEKVFIVSDIDRYYENNSLNQSIVNQLKTKGIGVYLIGNTISDVLKPLLKP